MRPGSNLDILPIFQRMRFHRVPPSGNGLLTLRMLRGPLPDFPTALGEACGLPVERMLFASSGTAALYLALLGMKAGQPDRGQVLLPAWCCPSVPQAVMQAGLEPVLLDLDPGTLHYAAGEVDKHLSDRTLAVLLVNFFGIPHPVPALPTGPFLLRDCAQDFNYRPEPDSAPFFYSFGRGKSLNTGHGGALCFPSATPLLEDCRKVLASLPESTQRPLAKMAAITLLSEPFPFWVVSQLPFLGIGQTRWEKDLDFARINPGFHGWAAASLEAFRRRKQEYAALTDAYVRILREHGCDRVHLPYAGYGGGNVPIRFPILVPDARLRDRLFDVLNRRYGGVTRQYPSILHRLPGAPEGFRPGREFPGAERIARELLTLPVTSLLGNRQAAFLEDLAKLVRAG